MEDDEFMNKMRDSAKRKKFTNEIAGKVLRDFKSNHDELIVKLNNLSIKNEPNLKDHELSIIFSNGKFSLSWKISCKTDPITVSIENNGILVKKYNLANSIDETMNISKDSIREIIIKDIAEAYNKL